ncbi:MAG: putative zinc-binding metallopeptidase [Burkholderiaceae bacterium]
MSAAALPYSRAYRCQCGRPVFFRNTQCVNCGSQLGFDPVSLAVVALRPAASPELWAIAGADRGDLYRFCSNRQSASACNWLIAPPFVASTRIGDGLCVSCALTRRMFDVSRRAHQARWRALETAKRRLVAQLLALRLPLGPHVPGGPGIAFDLLEPAPNAPVLTGHHGGVVTINAMEADDAYREATRAAMNEPYRTLLGHFRHEVGHYYWDRLVRDDPVRLAQFRALFGDERSDYAKALQRHYQEGPPVRWQDGFLTSYASTHPWEDWAETWAHYLHITDTLDTATSFGIDVTRAELEFEPLDQKYLWNAGMPQATSFLDLLNRWVQLTQVMNELTRSMGQADVYPFVLPYRAVSKLHFIHEIVQGHADPAPLSPPARRPSPD